MKRSKLLVLSKYVMLVKNKSVITGGIVVALLGLCLITLSEKKYYPLLPTQSKKILNNPTQFVAAGDKLNGHEIVSDNSSLVIDYRPTTTLYAPSNGQITEEANNSCFSFSMPAINSRITLCNQTDGKLEPILKTADGKYKGSAYQCDPIFEVSGPVRVSFSTSSTQLVDGKPEVVESYVALNIRKQPLNEVQQIQMSNAIPLEEYILPKPTPPC